MSRTARALPASELFLRNSAWRRDFVDVLSPTRTKTNRGSRVVQSQTHHASLLGLAGAAGVVASKSAVASASATGNTAHELAEAIEAMPVLDVHSHGFPALAPVTEEIFLETLALSAWMLDAYFPAEPGQDADGLRTVARRGSGRACSHGS